MKRYGFFAKLLILIMLIVFLYAAYMLIDYLFQRRSSEGIRDSLIQQAVTVHTLAPELPQTAPEPSPVNAAAPEATQSAPKVDPLLADSALPSPTVNSETLSATAVPGSEPVPEAEAILPEGDLNPAAPDAPPAPDAAAPSPDAPAAALIPGIHDPQAGSIAAPTVSADMNESPAQRPQAQPAFTDAPARQSEIQAAPIPALSTDPAEIAPISVDFAVLQETNADIVAWIYSPDTPINYPIVQGEDNDYYLHRLLNGESNYAGTLFMDWRNAADFSDSHTLIYGHNMRDDSMFGTLHHYENQEYYDAHPCLYLLTPGSSYRLELVAGYLTRDDAPIFEFPVGPEEALALAQAAQRRSTFKSSFTIPENPRFVTLSTCSKEDNAARYVVIGVLQQIGK